MTLISDGPARTLRTLANFAEPGRTATKKTFHNLALLAALVLMPSAAKAQNAAPAVTNWIRWGDPIAYTLNINQQLGYANLNLRVYKSPPTNDGLDWYLVAGSDVQSVNTSSIKGAGMDLNILGLTQYGFAPGGQNATLFDAQPASTTYNEQSTLSIGASLGISSSGPVPGIGLTYSVEVDAPSVVVGTTNAGNVANFHFSYDTTSSTQVQYAAIFNVKHGRGLFLQITPTASWHNPKAQQGQNVNLSAQGSFVADFGAAPAGTANGQQATGPQIVDLATGHCVTGQKALGQPVTLDTCDPNNLFQRWYYTGATQIVNVATNSCFDIGGNIPQGSDPTAGSKLVTNTCSSNDSQKWQLTTTQTSGAALNLRGMDGYIATLPGSTSGLTGQLLLAPPGSSTENTAFYLK